MSFKTTRKALTQAFDLLMKEFETLDSSPSDKRIKTALEVVEGRVMILESKMMDAEIAIAELRKL
jgi:hypothetical protein